MNETYCMVMSSFLSVVIPIGILIYIVNTVLMFTGEFSFKELVTRISICLIVAIIGMHQYIHRAFVCFSY